MPQPPVALFVGFGQGHPHHRFAETEMVMRGRSIGVQAFLDVAQTLSPGQLRKCFILKNSNKLILYLIGQP